MKATLLIAAFLAVVALAQAGPAPSVREDSLALATSVNDLVTRARCYGNVAAQVAVFFVDIPHNCLDLAFRTHDLWTGLYVAPTCIVYSLVGTYELAVLSAAQC